VCFICTQQVWLQLPLSYLQLMQHNHTLLLFVVQFGKLGCQL